MAGAERLAVETDGTEEEVAEILQAYLEMEVEVEKEVNGEDSKGIGSHRVPDSGSRANRDYAR